VAAKQKLEGQSAVFVLGRIENGGWYCISCSVANVSVQSSLKRGLVEGFTSYVLRNGKPTKGIPINTGRLLWPTREDTRRWVFA